MSHANIPFTRKKLSKEDIITVQEALESGILTNGPLLNEFEKAFAAYCGAPFAVAFSCGEAARTAALLASNLHSSDWIIAAPNCPFSFMAAPLLKGSRLFLADFDGQTGSAHLAELKKKLKFQSTRGRPIILAAHRGSTLDDLSGIDQMLNHPDALILEDGSTVLGSVYPDGTRIGSSPYSYATTFSLHPGSLITTGEGGIAVTNDESVHHKLLVFRDQAVKEGDAQILAGHFHPPTEFQAALGLSQLKRIDQLISKRKGLAHRYIEQLNQIPSLSFFNCFNEKDPVSTRFGIKIDFASRKKTRHQTIAELQQEGIESKAPSSSLSTQPILTSICKESDGEYPHCEAYQAQLLFLPFYDDLKDEEVDRIAAALKRILG